MNAGFARRVGNSNLIKNDEKGCLSFPAGMASSWQDFGEEGFLFCLFISRSLRPKKQKCRSVVSLEKWLVLYQCMYGFFQHTSLFCETAYYITFRNCVTTAQTQKHQTTLDYSPQKSSSCFRNMFIALQYSYFTTETAFSILIEL